MYTLRVKTHFDAAHRLTSYDGKCNREHGHRWEVEVALAGKTLQPGNMLIDFGEVKSDLNNFIDIYLDHHQLNLSLSEDDPTAEFLAKWIYDKMKPVCQGLVSVRVWESPDCSVEYTSEGFTS